LTLADGAATIRTMNITTMLRDATARPVSPVELARRWRRAVVTVEGAWPKALGPGHNLARLVRGAWKDVLHGSASPDARMKPPLPCSWQPPCAHDVLFLERREKEAKADRGEVFALPYVLAVDRDGDSLVATLTLFGHAAAWSGPAREALVLSMRKGIASTAGTPIAIDALSSRIDDHVGVDHPDRAARAGLVFVQPYLPVSGTPEPTRFFSDLRSRLRRLAPWHGVAIDETTWPSLEAAWDRLDVSGEWRGPAGFTHKGKRFSGWTGRLSIAGDLMPLLPLLAIGESAHVGQKAAVAGFGRYRLSIDNAI